MEHCEEEPSVTYWVAQLKALEPRAQSVEENSTGSKGKEGRNKEGDSVHVCIRVVMGWVFLCSHGVSVWCICV